MTVLRSERFDRAAYVIASLILIFSQNLVAWWAAHAFTWRQTLGLGFWLTPLRRALEVGRLPPTWGAVIFAYSLLVAWAVALLSFRIARRTNRGFGLAVLSVVPVVQLGVILLNAILPSREPLADEEQGRRFAARSVTLGLLAGVALIVLAVLVSAVTFGAYGWGLFVMTPFLVGITTGYLVNSRKDLGVGETLRLVMIACGLGSLALVVLALEGIVCIVMAAPLAIPVALLGGVLGRGLAMVRLKNRNPLPCIAVLPILFMMEAVIPPEAPIETHYEVEIDAPPETVWRALASAEPIKAAPGLPALAGLAYPISGKLDGEGVGAKRIGTFSTGTAIEVVTVWERNRALAFRVESQPPAMEEMSPYRRVHAPHVQGYFLTGETRFDLLPLPHGRTRLRVASEHSLRIDPAPYWEPIARLAIRQNVGRVLEDIKEKSENPPAMATGPVREGLGP